MLTLRKTEIIKQHLKSNDTSCFVDNRINLYDLLEYFCNSNTTAADVTVTSYSLSEDAIRCFINLTELGKIKKLTCILDYTIKKYKLEQTMFLANTNADVFLGNIHAKILLIKTDDRFISIISSANLNKVNRYECFSVLYDKASYDKIIGDLNIATTHSIPYVL